MKTLIEAIFWQVSIPVLLVLGFVAITVYYDRKEVRRRVRELNGRPKATLTKEQKKELDYLLDYDITESFYQN